MLRFQPVPTRCKTSASTLPPLGQFVLSVVYELSYWDFALHAVVVLDKVCGGETGTSGINDFSALNTAERFTPRVAGAELVLRCHGSGASPAWFCALARSGWLLGKFASDV